MRPPTSSRRGSASLRRRSSSRQKYESNQESKSNNGRPVPGRAHRQHSFHRPGYQQDTLASIRRGSRERSRRRSDASAIDNNKESNGRFEAKESNGNSHRYESNGYYGKYDSTNSLYIKDNTDSSGSSHYMKDNSGNGSSQYIKDNGHYSKSSHVGLYSKGPGADIDLYSKDSNDAFYEEENNNMYKLDVTCNSCGATNLVGSKLTPNSNNQLSRIETLPQNLSTLPNLRYEHELKPNLSKSATSANMMSALTPNCSSLVLNSLAYQVLLQDQSAMNKVRDLNSTRQRTKFEPSLSSSKQSLNSTTSGASSGPASSASPVAIRRRPVMVDDASGHLAYLEGDLITERYQVQGTLGEGTFGKVAKVRDLMTDELLALKIVRNVGKYRDAARLEVNVLRRLREKDPRGKHLCVHMIDTFDYFGHVCMLFEVLGESVFDFLKSNRYTPYPLDQVRHIGEQLCLAVGFLHEHKLTHTDLKPENVLFVSNDFTTNEKGIRRMRDTRIKLIDFGSATFDWEHHSAIISTRHYRAPEVILEQGWNQPCDVWSLGCIIFELHHGHTLFQTHDNVEHLAMMERVLGRTIPKHMCLKTRGKYFDSHLRLRWDPRAAHAHYTNQHCRLLHEYQRFNPYSSSGQREVALYDLVLRMLDYDPDFRIKLRDARKHRFFDVHMNPASGCSSTNNAIIDVQRRLQRI